MNEIQNRRATNLEKSFPGCMGRMVNLFDFGPGMTGNKLLTDSEHYNGSQSPRGRRDVVYDVVDPIGGQIEKELMGYDLRRSSPNSKSNGTPMKMLIAQEMSKETECKQNPPSLIAKLMGLDALPERQPNSTAQRSLPKDYSRTNYSQPGTPHRYLQQEIDFLDKQMQCEIHPFQEQLEYKDVYEVWQQSPIANYTKDKSPQKGRHGENQNEKMALVRQKFIEAKRLATDEKLRQSKEFQDALEVLSSNKDLFLKFLQEPNSLFSQHLQLHSIPPPPKSKRIMVLRPSRTLENNSYVGLDRKSEKHGKQQTQMDETNGWDRNKLGWSSLFTNQNVDNTSQTTRIVVLKPSPGKSHDIKASPPSSPRNPTHSKDFYGQMENEVTLSSREVAKEITRHMRENVDTHQKEETLKEETLMSVFSNGYVGDESSFNRSENDFVEEGNLSDSEAMTPISRYSWDYINRFGSPYSSSSFSRASCSPESSVCREAKKRLSERWAMMALNRTGQEQRQVRRSSSTLGEMLALSDTKKSVSSGEPAHDGGHAIISSKSCGGEQELKAAISNLSSSTSKDGNGDDSPRNLVRSKSVPVSSTLFGVTQNVDVSNSEVSKSSAPTELLKSKSGKSSFKGKVSSLFFSRNKKTSKEKPMASPAAGSQGESQSVAAEPQGVSKQPLPGKMSEDCVTNSSVEELSSPRFEGSSSKASSPASFFVEPKHGASSHEATSKSGMHRNPSENLDQPSPVSVLERAFDDDINSTSHSADIMRSDLRGESIQLHSLKSNLISKSPLIGSLARSLSWDDSEVAAPDPLNSSVAFSEAEEEQERFLFVQSLLSSTTLDHDEYSTAVFTRWHSPESPLDPSLLNKYFNQKDNKDLRHGAKFRQWRSNQKLIFDCVNVALVDITGYGSETSVWARVSTNSRSRLSIGTQVTIDEVWNRVKEWFSSGGKCFSNENADSNSLIAESVVRKEVVGSGWVELMKLEVDGIGKEVEGKMLEELVEEALFEFTGVLH